MVNEDANGRINNIWERSAIGLLTFIVSCMFIYQANSREDYKQLEEKVLAMQIGKVNKEDLREVEIRLNTKMDAGFSNLISRSASDKADLMRALDLYLGNAKTRH